MNNPTYIKYGQAQGPKDTSGYNRYWTLFRDLPQLYAMGIFKDLMVIREDIPMAFAITAVNSKGERVEIGRADCITVAAPLIDWIRDTPQDPEAYKNITGDWLNTIITTETDLC